MKILIVEDEDLAVKKLQKTLAAVDQDANVVGIADSIKGTVEWLQQNPAPDLILMDIQLPVIDGYEATRRIRAIPALAKVPIIAVTSYALSGDEAKTREAGCDGYVAKPFSPRQLLAKVREFLP